MMWPIRLHDKLVAEALPVRGLVARVGGHLTLGQKVVWKSASPELAVRKSLEPWSMSFQQKLRLAENRGITLREFEKLLA